MGGQISESRAFLRSFFAHPRHVGAVLPTSRRTVRETLDLADLSSARLVVELGAGTGVYTRELLVGVERVRAGVTPLARYRRGAAPE